VVGSSLANRRSKKDGALFGAIFGASVGAGMSQGACARPSGYYDNRDYGDRYDDHYGRVRSYDRYSYGVGAYGYQERRTVFVRQYDAPPVYSQESYYTYQGPSYGSCTLAESPIYLPDGHIQRRYVRVCADPNGRYQVVD